MVGEIGRQLIIHFQLGFPSDFPLIFLRSLSSHHAQDLNALQVPLRVHGCAGILAPLQEGRGRSRETIRSKWTLKQVHHSALTRRTTTWLRSLTSEPLMLNVSVNPRAKDDSLPESGIHSVAP